MDADGRYGVFKKSLWHTHFAWPSCADVQLHVEAH